MKIIMEDKKIEEEFNVLAKRWREETMAMSSTTDIISHPAYLEIIGMSEQVIPLILRELKGRLTTGILHYG